MAHPAVKIPFTFGAKASPFKAIAAAPIAVAKSTPKHLASGLFR